MNRSAEHWWKYGVLYQIYPRSFADSNHDGIGDLPGITSRLDYLADLGITGIWIGPIYPSPDVDFGYDISDYLAIDPKFGSMQDLERLIKEAHKRKIHIILDLVFNHTSNQHPWFLEARKSRENPYHDHYLWAEPKGRKKPVNNWKAVFGGTAWQYVPEVNQSYYHMFFPQQPDVNWRNLSVKKYLLDVFRFWLKIGVDGFRLDVFNVYFKDARLRNNSGSSLLNLLAGSGRNYDYDQPEMIPLLREIRQIIDEKPGRFVIGEVFNSNRQKAAFYTRQGLLNSVLDANDVEILSRPWRAATFLKHAQDVERLFEEDSWPAYFFSNHDMRRVATRYARDGNDARLKVVATMLLTLRGTPILYFGDEIGMRDVPLKRSELQDGLSRRFYPVHVRDGARSPMQWDESQNAGFSSGKPWMKVHPGFRDRNVQSQTKDPGSLYHYYKKLIALRSKHTALQDGLFLPLTHDPLYVLAYLRKNKQETVLVILNFSHRKMKFLFGPEIANTKWELLISSHHQSLPDLSPGYLQLIPDEVLVLGNLDWE